MRFFNLSLLFVVCALLYVSSSSTTTAVHAQDYDDATATSTRSLVEAETTQLAEDQVYFTAEDQSQVEAEAEADADADVDAEEETTQQQPSVDLSQYTHAAYSSEEALQQSGFIETANQNENENENENESTTEAEAEATTEVAAEAEAEAEVEAEAPSSSSSSSSPSVNLDNFFQPIYGSEETLQSQGFLEVVNGAVAWTCCRICPQVHLPSQDQRYGRVPAADAKFSSSGVEEGAETGATADESSGEGEWEADSFIQLLSRSRLVSHANALSGGCCSVCPGPIELSDNPNPRADSNGVPASSSEVLARAVDNSRSVSAPSMEAVRFSRSKPTHLPPCCNYCTTGHYSRTPYKQNAGLPAPMKELPPAAGAAAAGADAGAGAGASTPAATEAATTEAATTEAATTEAATTTGFLSVQTTATTMRGKMEQKQAALNHAINNQCCNQCKLK